MSSLFAPLLRNFAKRYDYDVGYVEEMNDAAPGTLWRYLLGSVFGQYRRAAPIDPYYAAKVTATKVQDCGPCLRLVCNMAIEAGVDEATLAAILREDFTALDEATGLAVRFANAVSERDTEAEVECRERLTAVCGANAIPDLAIAIAHGNFYPILKRGLGHANACAPVLAELEARLTAS